jgi:hypothetical protein
MSLVAGTMSRTLGVSSDVKHEAVGSSTGGKEVNPWRLQTVRTVMQNRSCIFESLHVYMDGENPFLIRVKRKRNPGVELGENSVGPDDIGVLLPNR